MEPSHWPMLKIDSRVRSYGAGSKDLAAQSRQAWVVHAWMGIIENIISAHIPPPTICVLHCTVSLQTAAPVIPVCATALIFVTRDYAHVAADVCSVVNQSYGLLRAAS